MTTSHFVDKICFGELLKAYSSGEMFKVQTILNHL